jgi:hypothetical protein
MANHASHAALPYPIKGARFTLLVPYLDADGDPTDPTTPDTEVSKDDGAAADCTEEVSSPKNSVGMLTLTGAETDCSCLSLAAKAASGPKTTLGTLYPRVLASVGTGTLSAGSAGGGTLGTLLAYDVTGCFIKTTGGTGGGGTGGANNQVRKIATYNTGTGAFTVVPNWETTPSTDTTYDVLLPDGVTLGMIRALNPTTPGRTLDVSSGGEAGVDWANVGSPTTTLNLSGTTVKEATDVQTTLTNRLVGTILTGNHSPQTGDAYAVVNNGTHGNAALKAILDTSGVVLANGAIAAGKIADGAFTAAKFASGAFDAVWTVADRTLTSVAGLGIATAAKLLSYFQSALRKDVTVDADIGGNYDDATDSLEAIRDRGDAAWTTATGFSTFDPSADKVQLHATQPDYAPAKAGDAMALATNQTFGGIYSVGSTGQIMKNANASLGATGATVNTINTDAISADSVSAAAVTKIQAAVKAVTDKLDDTLEDNEGTYRFTAASLAEAPTGGGSAPTAGDIADAVWDELLAGHVIAGSAGAGLAAAGSAGDPWATLVPGSYAAGTAGAKIGKIGTPNAIYPSDDPASDSDPMFTIIAGDTYSTDLGNAKRRSSPAGATFPDPTGRPIKGAFGRLDEDGDLFEVTGTLVSWTDGVVTADFPLTASESETLDPDVDNGRYAFDWGVEYAAGFRTAETGEIHSVHGYANE